MIRQKDAKRKFNQILAFYGDSVERTTDALNKWNPRTFWTWTEKYIIQVRDDRIKISRYLLVAINRVVMEIKRPDDPPLPVWVGRAKKDVRAAIYRIPAAIRLDILIKESEEWIPHYKESENGNES